LQFTLAFDRGSLGKDIQNYLRRRLRGYLSEFQSYVGIAKGTGRDQMIPRVSANRLSGEGYFPYAAFADYLCLRIGSLLIAFGALFAVPQPRRFPPMRFLPGRPQNSSRSPPRTESFYTCAYFVQNCISATNSVQTLAESIHQIQSWLAKVVQTLRSTFSRKGFVSFELGEFWAKTPG
jgi:hypothetical protein